MFAPYEGDGVARNIKTPTKIQFKPLEECLALQNIDENLQYYDWAKSSNLRLLQSMFSALRRFI